MNYDYLNIYKMQQMPEIKLLEYFRAQIGKPFILPALTP